MILGLTGSFGSGKSTVAQMLKSSGGAWVIDADQVARDLQQSGQAGFDAVVAEFGAEIVGADGELNRRKLAGIVFNDAEKLERLNAMIHPLVWEKVAGLMNEVKDHPLVVFMVPLLFETKTDTMCDQVVVVSISEEERMRRLMARDALTAEEIKDRLAAQMPQSEKIDRADFVIDNSGSLEQTQAQVTALLDKLGLAAARQQ